MTRCASDVCVVLSMLLCLPLVAAAPTASAGQTGSKQIVLLSNRESSNRTFDIVLLNLASLTSVNLTAHRKDVVIRSTSRPRFHRDSRSVIFLSYQPQSFVELNLSTRHVRKIVDVSYEATEYDLAPDGGALLYTEKVDTTLQLFEVDLGTGTARNLTLNAHNNIEPSYSHDGRTIVFVCDEDGSRSIALMNRDGTGQRILTNPFGDDRFPRFSPDDRRVVFSSSRSSIHEGDYHLYCVNSDGTNLRLLHQSDAFNSRPVWSPDSFHVAYTSNQRGHLFKDIYLKDLRTGTVKMVTKDLKYFNDNLVFSRDGHSLVFENTSPANAEIILYNVHTGALRNLTNSKSRESAPAIDW